MPQAIRGASGSGSVLVYTVPRDHSMRLELLHFTLTTSSATGVHSAMVTIYDSDLNATTAEIWDWNEGGASMTLYYTYGIGLRPFNCTVTTGMRIPNSLPDTILNPDTTVTVSAVDATCTTIGGDAISGVVLYGELLDATGDTTNPNIDLLPGLLPALAN